jgi:hypothetical protein
MVAKKKKFDPTLYLIPTLLAISFVSLLLAISTSSLAQNQTRFNPIMPAISPKPSRYLCPQTEWVGCMPPSGSWLPHCQPDFLKWAKSNCPGFKGGAF